MRLAILSDIHGNSAALDAVLADAHDCDLTLNLGDCLSGPLDAVGTAERLLAHKMHTVRGNHDRALIDRPLVEMGSWEAPVFPRLMPDHLDWLRGLPETVATEGLLACHGTPASDSAAWLDRPGADGTMTLAPQDAIEAEAATHGASGFLCGHTHIPRVVTLSDGRFVLNPGSVGCPAWLDARNPERPLRAETGSPHARYALLERRGGSWRAELRAVPYDARPMIDLARAAGDETWARALATGRVTP